VDVVPGLGQLVVEVVVLHGMARPYRPGLPSGKPVGVDRAARLRDPRARRTR
jgi:hypothetical protein